MRCGLGTIRAPAKKVVGFPAQNIFFAFFAFFAVNLAA